MKVTHVLTCALAATAVAASAASIEQLLNFSVVGWYQGVSTTNGVMVHDRTTTVHFTSQNMVRALAVDFGTNYYNGQLIYKTALDGSSTNIVIRKPGTNDLDVTGAFEFATGPFVIDEVVNTNAMITNSYTETGLRSFTFRSSSFSFTNVGLANGTLRRRKVASGTNSGYANLLNYTGGSATFGLNTNKFYTTNFQFAATNFVGGPAQINFYTVAPIIKQD